MGCWGGGGGSKEFLKGIIKTSTPHPHLKEGKKKKGDAGFVNNERLRKLACWLLGAQAAQENSMSSQECSQITWRERESAMAPGLRIQIPPGISLKDKPHTQKKTKSVTPRKSNQLQLNTVKKPAALLLAVISSVPCHWPWWLKLATLIHKQPLQESCSLSLLVCFPHQKGTLQSLCKSRTREGKHRMVLPTRHYKGPLWNPSTPQSLHHFWLPPGVLSWDKTANRQELSSQHRKPPLFRPQHSWAASREGKWPLGSHSLLSDAARSTGHRE